MVFMNSGYSFSSRPEQPKHKLVGRVNQHKDTEADDDKDKRRHRPKSSRIEDSRPKNSKIHDERPSSKVNHEKNSRQAFNAGYRAPEPKAPTPRFGIDKPNFSD